MGGSLLTLTFNLRYHAGTTTLTLTLSPNLPLPGAIQGVELPPPQPGNNQE